MRLPTNKSSLSPAPSITGLMIERIRERQEKIHQWLKSYENSLVLPIYSSVDIRDSGFKIAVVDTNLFPAGFNNLCEHGLSDSVHFMRQAILRRAHQAKNILIIAEEHTRNTWYLENVRILEEIIARAGFNVKIATFLTDQPSFCERDTHIDLKTATDQTVRIHCFKRILTACQEGKEHYDLIIMNNDLSTGIPDILQKTNVPIYPSMQAGWHARLKSHHFTHTANLIKEFSSIIDLDPWLFSCLFDSADEIDINNEKDRARLTEQAARLFEKINDKYRQHHIEEKPYILIKADAGTYGMGVLPIEFPSDILNLNRNDRNKLHKGKGSKIIRKYLLQEGVPTIYNIDHEVSEACIYQIENNLIGGFYRSHIHKGQRDNLNSPGMNFKKMCPHLKKYGDCGARHDISIFDIYRLLARIAGIAARQEIDVLEAEKITRN